MYLRDARTKLQLHGLTLCMVQYYGVAAVACTPNILIAAIVSGFFYGEADLWSGAIAHASVGWSYDVSCNALSRQPCYGQYIVLKRIADIARGCYLALPLTLGRACRSNEPYIGLRHST